MREKITRLSLDEVEKMKGKTQWAKLVAEERIADKKEGQEPRTSHLRRNT